MTELTLSVNRWSPGSRSSCRCVPSSSRRPSPARRSRGRARAASIGGTSRSTATPGSSRGVVGVGEPLLGVVGLPQEREGPQPGVDPGALAFGEVAAPPLKKGSLVLEPEPLLRRPSCGRWPCARHPGRCAPCERRGTCRRPPGGRGRTRPTGRDNRATCRRRPPGRSPCPADPPGMRRRSLSCARAGCPRSDAGPRRPARTAPARGVSTTVR